MDFKTYLMEDGLSESTIKAHLKKSQDYDFETLSLGDLKDKSLSQQLNIANTMSKYYKFMGKNNDEIVAYIKEVNSQRVPKKLTSTLTIKELEDKMNDYYDDKKYKNYVTMYLLLQFQVRNLDLVLEIVTKKHKIEDNKNYLIVSKKQVDYIRMDYKTIKKYGVKTITILEPKFIIACKKLVGSDLIQYDNRSYYVKKIVGIGETELVKVFLKENQNNKSSSFKQVSKNRGTDLTTLLENYTDT